MLKEIKAKIVYLILPTHPDKDYIIGGYNPQKKYEFEDIYRINTDNYFSKDQTYEAIKRDLRLVAGGGYDDKNISVYKYVINGKTIYV